MTARPSLTMTVTGYLAGEPNLAFTGNGKPVTNLSVPYTPRRYNQQTGQWEDAGETVWVRASIWGDEAELAANTLHKGHLITLTGRPNVNAWADKQTGQPAANLQLTVDTWAIHPRTPKNPGPQGGQTQAAAGHVNQQAAAAWNAPGGGAPDDPWATGPASDQPPF